MRLRRLVVDRGFRALNVLHRSILRVSGGRLGSSAFNMTMVELHTIGRRSGQAHTVLLAAPVVDGETLVLVASKGGDHREPDWLKNLLAHPDVDVTIRGERRPVHARVADAVEQVELWPRVIGAYRPYATYRRRANRVIPLVVCEPREDSDGRRV